MPIYVTPLRSRLNPNIKSGKTIIELDAFINEDHTYSNVASKHKTEKGFSVTDNIQREPIQLVVEAVISTTSLTVRTGVNSKETRADKAFKKLQRLWKNGNKVSVLTGLTNYKNLIITNIAIPRNKKVGEALRATITFREVIVANTKDITIDLFSATTIPDPSAESFGSLGTGIVPDTTFTNQSGQLVDMATTVESYQINTVSVFGKEVSSDTLPQYKGVQTLVPTGLPYESSSKAGQIAKDIVQEKREVFRNVN